ncbi:hypothetical protein A4R35_16985 [Thermogemmatispora tikiterensis]|uniref:Uncharacterized protein n=1 Tax=Thermogemmatispora tikiterensis TaxID=1825093 RepID=A0A328VHL7_9CHLR|nr:hypothetical protein A4R35_16985 [Thermogemmatispora tikiterensis]
MRHYYNADARISQHLFSGVGESGQGSSIWLGQPGEVSCCQQLACRPGQQALGRLPARRMVGAVVGNQQSVWQRAFAASE